MFEEEVTAEDQEAEGDPQDAELEAQGEDELRQVEEPAQESLTNQEEQKPQEEEEPEKPDPLQERLEHLQRQVANNTRVHQENVKLQQQLEEMRSQLDAVRERAETQALPESDPKHPNHAVYQRRAESIDNTIADWRMAQTQEEREAVMALAERKGITQQDIVGRMQQREKETDPRYVEQKIRQEVPELIKQEVSQTLQQERAAAQADQEIQRISKLILDNEELIKRHEEEYNEAIDNGWPMDKIIDKWKAEEKLLELSKTSAQTEERAKVLTDSARKEAVAERDSNIGGGFTADDVWDKALEMMKEDDLEPNTSSPAFYTYAEAAQLELSRSTKH